MPLTPILGQGGIMSCSGGGGGSGGDDHCEFVLGLAYVAASSRPDS